MKFETTPAIEWATAVHFRPRVNIVVPNVTWGLGLPYEADLLVMSPAGYIQEVEVKISKSDLRADLKKYHHHDGEKVRKLWFSMPEALCRPDCLELVPAGAGVIAINATGWSSVVRQAKVRKCGKATDAERAKLTYLGYVRLWGLKYRIIQLRDELAAIKEAQHGRL